TLDLALELGGLLQVVGQAHEDGVEDAAHLTRLNHVGVEVAEDLGVLGTCVGERAAGFDLALHLTDDLAEGGGFGLLAEDRQALPDGQAGVDHGGELAGEDDDVGLAHLRAEARQLDLVVEALALLAHLGDVGLDALAAQADDDGLPAGRVHLPAELGPLGGDPLPLVDRHPRPPLQLALVWGLFSPSIWRTSSGSVAWPTASSAVTRLRCTRLTRDWLMVCIPNFACPTCIWAH